jgi:pSer/pThr/pTyr-binding forkhead associated (FHA) protein
VLAIAAGGAYVFRDQLLGIVRLHDKTSQGEASEKTPSQDKTMAAEAARGAARQPVLLYLTVESSEGRGKRYELKLTGSAKLGRESKCDLSFPDDPEMSREHCLIELTNGKLLISDLKSENGTYLNGVKLFGRRPLENGDLLHLGRTQMRILVAG